MKTIDQTGEGRMAPMSLSELTQQIEATHHEFMKSEIPTLLSFVEKVARVHGPKDERLVEMKNIFEEVMHELGPHLIEEEEVLFPAIRLLDTHDQINEAQRRQIQEPILKLENDHDAIGDAFKKLNKLSSGYAIPDWACNTYRAMLTGLKRFEEYLHIHVHKENNVLFPRAAEILQAKSQLGAV